MTRKSTKITYLVYCEGQLIEKDMLIPTRNIERATKTARKMADKGGYQIIVTSAKNVVAYIPDDVFIANAIVTDEEETEE